MEESKKAKVERCRDCGGPVSETQPILFPGLMQCEDGDCAGSFMMPAEAPAGKWGPALDKEKVLDFLESQVWNCRDTQEKAGWNDAIWTLNGLVRDGKFDLSPEVQDALRGRKG